MTVIKHDIIDITISLHYNFQSSYMEKIVKYQVLKEKHTNEVRTENCS